MSISLKQFPAKENDYTKTGRNIINLPLPGQSVGFSDLTQSKLMLEITPTVTSGGNAMPWPVTFTQPTGRTNANYGSKASMMGAQALIRNVDVDSTSHGRLSRQTEQNIVSTNLDPYTRSRAEEDESNLFGNTISDNVGRRSNHVAASPFFSYQLPTTVATEVTQPGIVRQAKIPVDWKHIDEFASMQQFPNAYVGDIKYTIELENQLDVIQTAESPVNVLTITGANSGAAGQMPDLVTDRTRSQLVHPLSVGQQVYIRLIEGGNLHQSFTRIASITTSGNALKYTVSPVLAGLGNASACSEIAIFYGPRITAGGKAYYPSNIAAIAANGWAGDANNPLVFDNFFGTDTANNSIDYSRCPFVPGQYVCVHYSTVDANANAVYAHMYTKVAGITAAAGANGQPVDLSLRLEEPVPNAFVANGAVTDMVVSIPDHAGDGTPFSVSWTIDKVYAMMACLNLSPEQASENFKALDAGIEVPFLSRYVAKNTTTAGSSVTEYIQIPPRTLGVAVLTPQTGSLASSFDFCTSYRFGIEGMEVGNREIPCGMWDKDRSLHNLLVKQYFATMGVDLKKYESNWLNRAATGYLPGVANSSQINTHSFYPLVLPLQDSPTQIQINLETNDANSMQSKNMYFVSTRERLLRFKGGRVSVS